MILIYKRLTKKQLNKLAKDVVKQSEEFFAANPKRKTATAQVWYGKVIKIRRNHIQEDVDKAVEEELK